MIPTCGTCFQFRTSEVGALESYCPTLNAFVRYNNPIDKVKALAKKPYVEQEMNDRCHVYQPRRG